MDSLIQVSKTKDGDGQMPWTKNTVYKFNCQKRYPKIILKVGGKLFFDKAAWKELVEEERQRGIDTAKHVREMT